MPRVQEVIFLALFVLVDEAHRDLLFEKPLVRPLQVVCLIGLVLSVDDFSEHELEAVEQALGVAPVYAQSGLQLNLLRGGAELPVPFGFNEELYQPMP